MAVPIAPNVKMVKTDPIIFTKGLTNVYSLKFPNVLNKLFMPWST